MKTYLQTFLGTIFIILGLSACGGGRGSYSFDEFASDFNQTFCEKLVECELTSQTVSECVAEAEASQGDESECPEFSSESAENCVNETDELDCDADDLPASCYETCGT